MIIKISDRKCSSLKEITQKYLNQHNPTNISIYVCQALCPRVIYGAGMCAKNMKHSLAGHC